MTHDEKLVQTLKEDYRHASLDARTRAMLDFAVRITRDVHSLTAETIADLRQAGLADEDILNVVEIAGFFNYYTRVAEALGVEPEDFMKR